MSDQQMQIIALAFIAGLLGTLGYLAFLKPTDYDKCVAMMVEDGNRQSYAARKCAGAMNRD